ncbi:MAG: hypothetical protein JW983_09115 [Elusimicrobia bacterium]|nr:hypothetical protein [Elusimicrobiota bacterium]
MKMKIPTICNLSSVIRYVLSIAVICHLSYVICLYGADNGNLNIQMKIMENVWYEWDDCDSHYWEDPLWGRPVNLDWITFDSTECLRLSSNATSPGYMFARTKTFPQENWQNSVDKIRMDVYVECAGTGMNLKIDIKDSSDTTVQQIWLSQAIPAGEWVDCVWDIDQSLAGYSNIKQLIFAPDNLGSNLCTYYFENLRFVMTDNTTWYWDNFNDSTNVFIYAGDAIGIADSVITHNGSTSTLNAGSLYMEWNSTVDGGTDWAKIETWGYHDFSRYMKIRAEIKCSATAADISVGFWNETEGWLDTGIKSVSTANTWETLEWNMPFNIINPMKIIIVIKNTDEVNTGNVYIDNINFLK